MMISALSDKPELFTYHVNFKHRKKNEQYLIPTGNRIQTKNDGSYNIMSFEFHNNSDNSDNDDKSFIITFKKKRDKTIKEKDVGDFIYNTLVEGVRYELGLNTKSYESYVNKKIYRDLAHAAIQELEENEELAGGGYGDIIDIVDNKDRKWRDFRIHVDYNVNVNKTFKEEDGVTVIQKNIYNLKF